MRTVGIDPGEKRLGVAVSDADGIMAVPHSVVQLTGNKKADLTKVVEIILELKAKQVVVGLPLTLKGQAHLAAKNAEKYANSLKVELSRRMEEPIPVALYDERLTSVSANKLLVEAGVSAKKSREKTDMLAASIILQSWLDTQKNQAP